MTVFRFFSRLDIKNLNVVKGIQLDGLRRIGEPITLAKTYSENGADELVLVDVVASLYNRPNLLPLVSDIANELRIPLTTLGGIRSFEDARGVFNSGADKVAINSYGLQYPEIFTSIARIYGSQSVVCSIEAKQVRGATLWTCMTENGRHDSGIEISDWIPKLEGFGVGEVFVTSVDKDGTNRGPDLELCARVRALTELPVIYSGGVRSSEDIYDIAQIGIDGVAVASALHYGKLQIGDTKSFLISKNIFVRS